MNSLEIRVKASTVKIGFRNVFGNTLDFVRELWFMILLDINSNKNEQAGRKILKFNKWHGTFICGSSV